MITLVSHPGPAQIIREFGIGIGSADATSPVTSMYDFRSADELLAGGESNQDSNQHFQNNVEYVKK